MKIFSDMRTVVDIQPQRMKNEGNGEHGLQENLLSYWTRYRVNTH